LELGVSYNEGRNVATYGIFPSDNGEDIYQLDERSAAIELDVKYGVTENFDLGAVLSTAKLGISGKYNFYNYEKLFSFAGGLGVGRALGGTYIQSQIFASYHPSKRLAFYLNPNYALALLEEYSTTTFRTDNLDFYGANLGFLVGDKIKVGADIGLFRMAADRDQYNMLNLGIGAKIRFGD